jgi:Protein of unknown function (DUF1524)
VRLTERFGWRWVIVVLTLIVVAGCSPVPGQAAPAAPLAVLNGLAVVARPKADGTYRRAAFGPAWADVDGNSCSQRIDSLYGNVDKSMPFTMRQRGRCTHDVVSGTWSDPYTGQLMTFSNIKDPVQAQAIPIDHIVALAVGWRYGASMWSAERRLQFANDLDNLQPTSQRSNSSKGGLDAAAWRPRKAGQCAFASRYIVIKARYALPVDQSEKNALTEMLGTC